MKTIRFLHLICSLAIATIVSSQTYYLSTSGDDSQDGKSGTTAWKTFSKALTTLKNGDSLLLKRGDVFRDSADFSKLNHLTIASYGPLNNPKPVISGSEKITGWTVWNNSIYVAQASGIIQDLFADDKRLTCARYPNSGWLFTTSGSATSTASYINSTDITKNKHEANNYWIGAECHWHRWSWWDEVHEVTFYNKGGMLYLKYKTTNSPDRPFAGWGFYMDNKLEELDSVGEWYQDKATKKVYVRMPKDDDPNNHLIEGARLYLGMAVKTSHVKDIHFSQQFFDGLEIDDSCVVENCIFNNIFFRAIHAKDSAHHCLIQHNEFYDNNNLCINWYAKSKGNGAIIQNNIIKRTAVIPANQNRLYGVDNGKTDKMESWWWFNAHATAIIVWYGTNCNIRYNRIDSTGYIPIALHSDGNTVEYNYIDYGLLNLNDGGGIYVNCSNTKIRNNIVKHIEGNVSATKNFPLILAHGIWPEFLFDFKKNVLENNTCIENNGFGIFLPNEFNDTLRSNTCYGNKRSQLDLSGDAAKGPQGHVIENNIFFGVGRSQPAITFETGIDYGSIKGNYIGNPLIWNEINNSYASEQWSLIYPWIKGPNPTDSIKIPEYRTWERGTEIIADPSFSQGASNWTADAKSPSTFLSAASDQPLLQGQCMKVSLASGSNSWNYVPAVTLDQAQFYELRLDYTFQKLDLILNNPHTSWLNIGIKDLNRNQQICYYSMPASQLKKSAWIVIPSKFASDKVQIQFSHITSVTNTVWLDNVSLKPVKAQLRDPRKESKIIYNDSSYTRTIATGEGSWHDIYGKPVNDSVKLNPFRSIILIRKEDEMLAGIPEEKIPVSLKEKREEPTFSIYPNPAATQLVIEGLEISSFIRILDMNGQIMQQLQNPSENIILDVSSYPSGIYIIQILPERGKVTSRKMIIAH